MPLRIRKLTRKQNAALKTYRDKWRALVHSTEPADREKAERGVRLMYSAWGLPAPKKYIWVENPADAFLLAARTRYTAKPVDTKIVLAGWSTINSTIDGISTHILDKLRMRGAVLHNRQLNSYIFRCASAAMADRKTCSTRTLQWNRAVR